MRNHLLIFVFTFLSFTNGFSQDEKDKDRIKQISDDACACIYDIELDATKQEKSEKIKSCIQASNMSYQLTQNMMGKVEKVKDTLRKIKDISKIDSLTIKEEDIDVIVIDQDYEAVEAYLYDNCEVMKQLYFTDNTEHDNSFSDRKKAKKFYESGQRAFGEGKYEVAITLFKKAVKKDKKFAFAWDNLGYSYRKIGNYDEAISCYQKSLKLDPKGKMPLMNIAVAYQLKNDLDGAIKAYQNYKIIYPNDPEGFYGLGRIQYFKKEYEPALENMIQAYYLYLEMDSPYNIDAQKHISFLYTDMKEAGQLDAFNTIAKKYKLTVNVED